MEILEDMAKRWAEKEGEPLVVGCYDSAEQFLFGREDELPYDLAFLDIQMAKTDGLQLARRIGRFLSCLQPL